MKQPKRKNVEVKTEWWAYHTLEVPADWKWDGTFDSLLEFDDLSPDTARLIDWEVDQH